jgi:hypothetical protein
MLASGRTPAGLAAGCFFQSPGRGRPPVSPEARPGSGPVVSRRKMVKVDPMSFELNEDIADRLDEVSRILGEQGSNRFPVRAFQHAATALREFSAPVSEIFANEGIVGLEKILGVGETIARSIRDLVHGKLAMLQRLRGEHDPLALLQSVPGIGKVTAMKLYEDLGIENLEELRRRPRTTDGWSNSRGWGQADRRHSRYTGSAARANSKGFGSFGPSRRCVRRRTPRRGPRVSRRGSQPRCVAATIPSQKDSGLLAVHSLSRRWTSRSIQPPEWRSNKAAIPGPSSGTLSSDPKWYILTVRRHQRTAPPFYRFPDFHVRAAFF